MTRPPLERLREEIRRIDAEILDLTARRLELARQVGDVKNEVGLPIRNYAVEAEVIRLARERARDEGVSERFAEDLVKMLIKESLRVQERDRLAHARETVSIRGKRALVVGGAGRMGRWFVEFLESKGFGVSLCDPRATDATRPLVNDLQAEAAAFDVIVLATPPSAVGPTMRSLQGHTDALVFEIGSLKSPFIDDVRALAASGAAATSIHPMWGPDTDLLASKNVIICDCGNDDANRAARALFADTAARIVEMPIEQHDGYMARTLGLPHAVNLVFGHALHTDATPLSELLKTGGPTFLKQVDVAREVARENKDLYYEIQKMNPATPETLALLRRTLDAFEAALASKDAFRAFMADAERYFATPATGDADDKGGNEPA